MQNDPFGFFFMATAGIIFAVFCGAVFVSCVGAIVG